MTAYFPDARHYGESGHLFPYDVRYDPEDRAHCDPQLDGTVRFRLVTEPGFDEARVVLHTGEGIAMGRWAEDGRFQYWEGVVAPPASRFRYTFALRHGSGRAVYLVPAGISNAVERLDRWELDLDLVLPLDIPQWAAGAFIYQIFPERFANGDPGNDPPGTEPWGTAPHWHQFQGGDLDGITGRLDYLADLGVQVIYVNPIFTSPSNHKYDAVDFYEVDPAFGGNDALRRLVEGVHARGMRIIVDASFNHCHPRFFAFADVLERGEASPYASWFVVEDHPPRLRTRPHLLETADVRDPERFADYLAMLPDQTGLNLEEVAGEGPLVEATYEAWYGVPTMPRIDLSDPGARQYFIDVGVHWIREYRLDGLRMDVARYVDFDFWRDFRLAVRAARPDAYLLAEVMGEARPWLQGDRFDATMNYTFRELCLGYFAERTLATGAFVGGVHRMLASYAREVNVVNQNLLASHDTGRFLTAAGGDRTGAAAAMIFQFTAPGAPGVYYGEEIGMTGGEEPASRGAFPWDDPGSWDEGLRTTVRELAALRRDHPALRRGTWRTAATAGDAFAFLREHDGERLAVAINRGPDRASLSLPAGIGRADVLWGAARVSQPAGSIRLDDLLPGSGLVARLTG